MQCIEYYVNVTAVLANLILARQNSDKDLDTRYHYFLQCFDAVDLAEGRQN